ncbi:MAG: YcgN family cysteine cluster protein [Pseudomonadales bacterium]|nr:YcgN family cysteine cluster protein [Pseudomonadales bacterium]
MGFWHEKSLAQMSDQEWESLCDGCARCCMIKLEDESDGSVHYTALVCELLDEQKCRCTRYPRRHELVPDCIQLTPDLAGQLRWLPTSCAYRRLAEGKDLLPWHPLVSGDPESVHQAGISVRDRVIPVHWVHEEELEDHIVNWIET